jgi:predicted trehalose synthase
VADPQIQTEGSLWYKDAIIYELHVKSFYDSNGARTPMQWSADLNAGFSTANPQQLFLPVIIDPEYHFTTLNVENQRRNLSSLLWFVRRLVAQREGFQAFGRGSMQFLPFDNSKVLTYLRTYGAESILVVANLSRQSQAVHVEVPAYAGYHVRDVFSGNEFPRMREGPYIVTLTPYAFYWFAVEWQRESGTPLTIGLLVQFVPRQGDAWSFALDNVGSSLNHALTLQGKLEAPPELPASVLTVAPESVPTVVRDFIGPVFLEMMGLLGRRTGELHLALASLSQSPDVTPEPFSLLYQKSLYQSIRGLTLKVFNELEDSLRSLDVPTAEAVKGVLANRRTILSRLHRIIDRKIAALKIRTHGDYHLGQVLYTGKDFVIIEFEGEPDRPLTERRLKQSALRDVAALVRSFHYAAQGSLLRGADKQSVDIDYLRPWAGLWYLYVAGVFLHAYRRTVADSRIVPTDPADFAVLWETFLLEKAVYELGYELNHRPDWLMIPVRGLEQILR